MAKRRDGDKRPKQNEAAAAANTQSFAGGSIVVAMLEANKPLSGWKSFQKTGGGWGGRLNPEKIARAIYSQLCNSATVEVVAADWDNLPSHVRIALGTIANGDDGSNNAKKGAQELNTRIGGRLFRQENRRTMNVRTEGVDGVFYRQRTVRPEVAGATQKYGKLSGAGITKR